MSQIETQRDELEEDGRRIESALRDTDERKYFFSDLPDTYS